jgi:3-mercaptopyruvate sulfurtransferase SseA
MMQPRAVIAGLLLLTAACAFAAPQATNQTPQTPAAEAAAPQAPADPLDAARRISVDEARKAVEKGQAVLVDVRAKESYDAEHAQGALSIPLAEITSRANELPKDKLVITYCT